MRSPLGVVAPRLQEVFRGLGFDSAAVVPFGHYAIGFPPGLKAPHPHALRLLARL